MDIFRFKSQLQPTINRLQPYWPATFFVAGFLFDIFTLSEIDDTFSLTQQTLYLLFIGTILYLKNKELYLRWQCSLHIKKIWQYQDEILHFLLGSLLSSYTLFYFVSSSLSTSFLFMIFIIGLLVVNEFPQIQKGGLYIKYALFSVCLFSYLFIVSAILFGFVGLTTFALSLTLGLGVFYLIQKKLQSVGLDSNVSGLHVFTPAALVGVVLLSLYFLKLLPPIPLSVQYIGIYHDVQKQRAVEPNGTAVTRYILKYERPIWKFWQNGDQDFRARPGDKIFCFVRVFSPRGFKDQVVFHWLKKAPNGWMTSDKITNDITGGRDQGFRALAVKSRFEAGDWRVQLETTDGRPIGRIDFTVTLLRNPTENGVAESDREFKTDIY